MKRVALALIVAAALLLGACATVPSVKLDQVVGAVSGPGQVGLVITHGNKADMIAVYQAVVDSLGRVHFRYVGYLTKDGKFHKKGR